MKKLLLIFVVAIVALTARADGGKGAATLHFKSGEVMTGVITSRTDDKVEIKVGANVINQTGFFLSPSVGWHFATNQYFTINVGVGYALHTAHYRLHCLGDTPGAINDGIGGAYLNKGAAFHNVFAKVGVEF